MIALIRVMFLVMIFCQPAYADTLVFKNGRQMEGIIRKETDDEVALYIYGGLVRFQRSQIERIIRSSGSQNANLKNTWDSERKERLSSSSEPASSPKAVDIVRSSQAMMVDVLLNKRVKARMVIDTGAGIMSLSKGIAKKLGVNLKDKEVIQVGLADGSKVDAAKISLDYVSVQGVQARDVEAAVMLEESEGMPGSDGLLGMSFLNRFNFHIDTDNGKLILDRKR